MGSILHTQDRIEPLNFRGVSIYSMQTTKSPYPSGAEQGKNEEIYFPRRKGKRNLELLSLTSRFKVQKQMVLYRVYIARVVQSFANSLPVCYCVVGLGENS